MSKTLHLCLDIRGALHKSDRELQRLGFRCKDGHSPTGAEVREFLMDHLQQGHRVIPMSRECVGFSYETGCPGHEEKESEP